MSKRDGKGGKGEGEDEIGEKRRKKSGPAQTRIPGTDGKPVPDALRAAIVLLKKKADTRKRAKESENKAQGEACRLALEAGYKAGDVVNLDDESPPLKFEVKVGDPKIKVMVQGREKRDELEPETEE